MSEEGDPDVVELGDQRPKSVEVVTETGERVEHTGCYLRHTTEEFIVSTDESFSESTTSRYSKSQINRINIAQHHSRCFITTAVSGDSTVLCPLRDFRDDTLSQSRVGRGLVYSYETLSPPIARTLARSPDARVVATVERLVTYCAYLAALRDESSSSVCRSLLTTTLVALYAVGIAVAVYGHVVIRLREGLGPAA